MSTATSVINTFPPNTTTTSQGQSGTITFVPPEGTPKITGKLAEALARAQTDFRAVPKTKTAKINPTFSYKYADLSDVLGMVVPILAKHGIAFTQPIRREGDKMYVVTRLQLGNEIMEDSGLPVPSQVKPQEMGTYITYARRYGVSTFLGIAADEDTDAQETRDDKPVSTTGQTLVQSAKAASNPTQDARQAARRGRPANPPIVKATEIVPPIPVENAGPQIATDDDVPSNIGDKPSPEERKEFLTRLKKFIEVTGVDAMKKYMGGDTNLTKIAWTNLLAKLDAAQTEGKLKELVNV